MFCTYCKQTRIENDTPCPHCGAPSPLLQVSGIGQWGTSNSTGAWTTKGFGLRNNLQTNSWGGPATYGASPQAIEAPWEQAPTNQPIQQQSPLVGQAHGLIQEPMGSEVRWEAPAPQIGIDQEAPASSSLNASWPQLSPAAASQNMSAWPDNGAERQMASQALLPVVYQEPQMNDIRQSTVALQLIPDNAIEHLLPGMPALPESVYVPPLYTNPRPLIPKYRIISGTLSVLIVALLLCTGAGYYAQMNGTLGNVVRLFTGAPPPSVSTSKGVNLPAPPDKIDFGPARDILSSGTTTLRIDKDNVPLETDKVFTVNQNFYVTYIVQPPAGQDGKVSVKWYMDGQLYHIVTSDVIKGGGTAINGSLQMRYARPAEGSVEINWNDQLGARFYFVVQPAN
jgi:hypothetical protein